MCVCIKWLQKLQNKNGKNVILKHLFIITKKKINKLRQKMSDIEIQLGHSNIADVVLQRIRNYCGKKRRKRKRKIQSFF